MERWIKNVKEEMEGEREGEKTLKCKWLVVKALLHVAC